MSRRRRLSAAVLAFAFFLGGLLGGLMVSAAPASAHDVTTKAHATVTGTGADVRVVLDLEYDLLMKSAWLYAEAYDAKERAEQLRQLRKNHAAVADYVTRRFAVAYGDAPCAPTSVGDADVRDRDGVAFAVVTLAYRCAGDGGGGHTVSSALFPDAESFVHSTQTIVRYTLDGTTGSAVLTAGNPTLRVGEHRASHQAGEFFLLGAEHLLSGLDHVFFLLALIIGARRPRDVVVAASAFTAAHSITFLMAALGIVDVPAEIVEPVIAVSIIVVAVANLLGRDEDRLGGWRLPIVFAFGLVHGLGFASVLDIEEKGSWGLLLSLLCFNAGIEATQLLIIAVLFPVLALLRRTSAARWVTAAMSVPIVAVSLYWCVDRIAPQL